MVRNVWPALLRAAVTDPVPAIDTAPCSARHPARSAANASLTRTCEPPSARPATTGSSLSQSIGQSSPASANTDDAI